MTQQGSGPPPVTVGLGRSNTVVALAVTAVLGAIVWAGARGGWTASETSSRYLGYGVAVLFAIPLVMMLRALPRFLRPRSIIVDATGVHLVHGAERVVLPWPAIAAIGIGYEEAPGSPTTIATSVDGAKDAVVDYLTDKAGEALQISGARRYALEIFPIRPDVADHFPRLAPFWSRQRPPVPGLPDQRWRYPLPPVATMAREIARGVQSFQPQRWLGWFSRPWTG